MSGLVLAVTGVGSSSDVLPSSLKAPETTEGEEWSTAFAAPTGWCVVLSQDCDLVSGDDSEPTLEIGEVKFVPTELHSVLRAQKYIARYLTLPEDSVPDAPRDTQPAIDLAWRSSVLKLSLDDPTVKFLHVFTEPQRRELAEWLASRSARVAFPDDLIEYVLDPFAKVLEDRAKSGAKKSGGARTVLELLVFSVSEWYVEQTELTISLIGTISKESLIRGGWTQEQIDESVEYDANGVGRCGGELEKARQQLHTSLQNRVQRLPKSGYGIQVILADLDGVPASKYRQWRRFAR